MLRILAGVWRYWLKFTMWFGTVQMVLLLTIVYWVAVPFIALPLRLLSDPLRLRRPAVVTWQPKTRHPIDAEWMRNQF